MMMDNMDHGEVRGLLEDAAIEPGGLERLMAGDTPAASIVAGHLAGCPDCAEELERLRRSVRLIQPAVRAVPPPELRERTLAYVAALGRPRGAALVGDGRAGGQDPDPRVDGPAVVSLDDARTRRPGRVRLGWLAGLAAALIVAVGGTAVVLDAGHRTTTNTLTGEVHDLAKVARWTLRVDAQPDTQRIQLVSATGATTSAEVVYSPSSTELVVVADGLAPAPAGHEYRCWVEVDGRNVAIGKMFFGGDLAYWVGEVPTVATLAPGARFGVTLVDLAAPDTGGQQVLVSGS